MQNDSTIYDSVMRAMQTWQTAYSDRDIERLLASVAKSDSVLLYGTGADEKRIGRAEMRLQAERDWSQTEAASFEVIGEPVIGATDSAAWVGADVMFNGTVGDQTYSFPGRLTCVFVREGGDWRMVQFHASLPANQPEGESVPQAQWG